MTLNHNEYLNYTLPNNWCAEEDIDNLLLYNPSGNGSITTSFFNVLLPFKFIVVTAWLAYSNVDLFIRGHKKRQEP